MYLKLNKKFKKLSKTLFTKGLFQYIMYISDEERKEGNEMKKFSKGFIEIEMTYIERTIWTDGKRFYVKFNHKIKEVKEYTSEEGVWYFA